MNKVLEKKFKTAAISQSEIEAERARLMIRGAIQLHKFFCASGLKLKELSAKTGIPKKKLNEIINGERKVGLRKMAAIALACNKRIDIVEVATSVDIETESA